MTPALRKLIASITLTGGIAVAAPTQAGRKSCQNQPSWLQRGRTCFYDTHTLERYATGKSGSGEQALAVPCFVAYPWRQYQLSQQIYGLWDKQAGRRFVLQTQGRWSGDKWAFSLIHSRVLPSGSPIQLTPSPTNWSGILTWHCHQKAVIEYQLSAQGHAVTGHVWTTHGWKMALSFRREGGRWKSLIRLFPFKTYRNIEGSFERQLDLLLLARAGLNEALGDARTSDAGLSAPMASEQASGSTSGEDNLAENVTAIEGADAAQRVLSLHDQQDFQKTYGTLCSHRYDRYERQPFLSRLLGRPDSRGQPVSEKNVGAYLAIAVHPDLTDEPQQAQASSALEQFIMGESQRSDANAAQTIAWQQRCERIENLLNHAKNEVYAANHKLAPLEVVLGTHYPSYLEWVYRVIHLRNDHNSLIHNLKNPLTGKLEVSLRTLDLYLALALDESQIILENETTVLDMLHRFIEPRPPGEKQSLTLLPALALEKRLREAEKENLGTPETREGLRRLYKTLSAENHMRVTYHAVKSQLQPQTQIESFIASMEDIPTFGLALASDEIRLNQYLALALCASWNVENNRRYLLERLQTFFQPDVVDRQEVERAFQRFEKSLGFARNEGLGSIENLHNLEAALLERLKAFPPLYLKKETKRVYEQLQHDRFKALETFFMSEDCIEFREVSAETFGAYVAMALDTHTSPHPGNAFGLHQIKIFLTQPQPDHGMESIQSRCDVFETLLDELRQMGIGTAETFKNCQDCLDQVRGQQSDSPGL